MTSNQSPVDMPELRGAIVRRDAKAALAALERVDYSDILQYAGMAALVVLDAEPQAGGSIARSIAELLRDRGGEGDDLLADELDAAVQGTPLLMPSLPVDLEDLSTFIEGSESEPGAYLDIRTGEVIPDFMTDPAMVGEDAAVDVEEDSDRWVVVPRVGSRAGWNDMATYAARVTDERLGVRLEDAIHGRGAFRRFKQVIWDAGLGEQWHAFSDDRKIGRARELVHDLGFRVRH